MDRLYWLKDWWPAALLFGVSAALVKVVWNRLQLRLHPHIDKLLDRSPTLRAPGPVPPPAAKEKPVGDPDYVRPDYTEGEFYKMLWRWTWGFHNDPTNPRDWHPFDLKPYCLKCDGPLDAEDMITVPFTNFVCRLEKCAVVTAPAPESVVRSNVEAMIEREWRRRNRSSAAGAPQSPSE